MLRRFFASFLLLTGLVASTGCIANQYGTPRTLPPGKVSHTLALEGYKPLDYKEVAPQLRYQVRVGLADRVDLGLMAGPLIGADLKLNFLRTKRIDISFNPGIHYGLFPSFYSGFDDPFEVVRGSAAFSVGINLTKAASLYLHTGVAGGVYIEPFYEAEYVCQSPQACETVTDHPFAMPELGIGAQFRVSQGIALLPEMSLVTDPQRLFGTGLQFGLAIALGAQPSYDDLDERAAD